MNTISKVAIVITSSFLFLPAYAQTTAEQQAQQYTQELQKITEDEFRSQGMNENRIQTKLKQNLPRSEETANRTVSSQWETVKSEHPNFTEAQSKQEVDKRLAEKAAAIRHTIEARR